jgi:hypothetical protein
MLLLLFWNNEGVIIVDEVIAISGGSDYLVTRAVVEDDLAVRATVTDALTVRATATDHPAD